MIATERDDIPLRAEHAEREHSDVLHLHRCAAAVNLRHDIRRIALEPERADEFDHESRRLFVHAVNSFRRYAPYPLAARFFCSFSSAAPESSSAVSAMTMSPRGERIPRMSG